MPKFNGQNKKRIDPRYFYDELLEKKDPLGQGHYKGLEKEKDVPDPGVKDRPQEVKPIKRTSAKEKRATKTARARGDDDLMGMEDVEAASPAQVAAYEKCKEAGGSSRKCAEKMNEARKEEATKALKEDQDPWAEMEGSLEKTKKKVKCPRNTRQGKAMASAALKEAAGKDASGEMDVMNKYCISDTKRKGRRTLVVFQNGIRVVV
jgi:hypothetical protein